MKKLIGNTDIEDSLDRLDKLTQEEARMASAELLKMTRIVDGKVVDVGGKVQDVGNNVKGVDDKVQGISSDLKDISSDVREVNRALSFQPPAHRPGEDSDSFTGNQLMDSLLRWLSPPDPSINNHIARKAHYTGTAQWFLQSSIFNQWKSTDPFMWIHGKRTLPLAFTCDDP